jgi:tetratricopeptide (TPR) repeat protein
MLRIRRFYVQAYWLLPIWFLMELFSGMIFGEDGVAHMAHVGGFVFGAIAALAIRHSKLEHVINDAIEQEVDPSQTAVLDDIRDQALRENQPELAMPRLQEYVSNNPASENGLLLIQELYWRKNDLKGYGEYTQRLLERHLAVNDIDRALKDYQDFISHSGGEMLPAKLWFRLCQALEARQEFERALGEYQEISYAYPEDPQSLMALMAGGRLALTKLNRPEQALLFYEAAHASAVPHLDLDDSIRRGQADAAKALRAAAEAAGK